MKLKSEAEKREEQAAWDYMKQNHGMATYEEARRKVEQEVEMEIEGEWREISLVENKEIYWKLVESRRKCGNYEPKRAHTSLKQIKSLLSPKDATTDGG